MPSGRRTSTSNQRRETTLARTVRDELRYADNEARRYVRSQLAEAQRLGYPKMAAFAKDIARGTVSLAPTPEDADLEKVGGFVWRLGDVERRVFVSNYGEDYTLYIKAKRLGMTIHRFRRIMDRTLTTLSGYLMR
jgi:hypothetical protein